MKRLILRINDFFKLILFFGNWGMKTFTIFNIFRVYKPLKFYSAFFLMFSILSLTAAYPVIDDWIVHRYVYHVPLAILSTGLGVIAILSLSLGLILDAITQQYNVNYEHNLLNTSINKE